MEETVSRSLEGQFLPKPSREERDAAFSSGGGRKAEDVPKEKRETASQSRHDEELEPPVGLDLETKADQDLQ